MRGGGMEVAKGKCTKRGGGNRYVHVGNKRRVWEWWQWEYGQSHSFSSLPPPPAIAFATTRTTFHHRLCKHFLFSLLSFIPHLPIQQNQWITLRSSSNSKRLLGLGMSPTMSSLSGTSRFLLLLTTSTSRLPWARSIPQQSLTRKMTSLMTFNKSHSKMTPIVQRSLADLIQVPVLVLIIYSQLI